MKNLILLFFVLIGLDLQAQMSFAYRDFYDPEGLAMVGTTQQHEGDLRLVSAQRWQHGAVWYGREQVPVAKGFQTEFTFKITRTCGCEHGADGVALVLHTQAEAQQLGDKGGGMGYAGIGQSLAIEFDAFDNHEGSDHHVSIQPGGHTGTEHSLATNHSLSNLKDSRWHRARIRYEVGRMKVFLDDMSRPVLDVYLKLERYLDMQQGKAWIGLTSATGHEFAHHDLGSWSFLGKNPPKPMSRPKPSPQPTVVVSETNDFPTVATPRPEPSLASTPQGPMTLEGRPVTTTRTIKVASPEITLYMWDHNRKDGDIISIFVNGNWVVQRFKLKKRKKAFDIYLGETENTLVLHAHNLGKIPPNTASMIVYDGVRRQYVTLRSNLNASEAVKIVYEQ